MAARTHPNTPSSYVNEERLPAGRCNYSNLSAGANAPVCGCRRFWHKGSQDGKSGFCMCEHHACFHDEGEKRSVREEVVERDVEMVEATGTTIPNTPRPRQEPRRESIPDTMQWGQYVNTGGSFGLPAIPSQCLLPSDNGSITSGSQSAYYRPFRGLGLHTLSHIPTPETSKPVQTEKSMQIYDDTNGQQSLTDIATPSQHASQDPAAEFDQNIAGVQNALERIADRTVTQNSVALRPTSAGSSVHIKQSGSGDMESPPSFDSTGKLIPRLKYIVGQLAEYPNKIQNHERRLDHLENASFSNPHIEDLQEADDRLETRIGELEERVVDVEKAQALNDTSTVSSRHNDGSFLSVTSSAMISSALDRIDASRVEALEAQVAELQASALPSYTRPWEVEVVFLPFGHELMGIWSSHHMSQRSRHPSTATDDWTQTQHSLAMVQACLTAHDQTAAWERSATDLGDQEDQAWLMAKACGLRSRVDERLRSRGLVRKIQIFGPDARDVQAAMMTAFGDLPDLLTEDPYTQHEDENFGTVPPSLKTYIGLSSSWIPLRKLHKDGCLRFLNPAEMITPALWTVPFLSSSVAMRHSGTRRLYVTQRDSYIQHLSPNPSSWTWAKLRLLPRIYPSNTTSTPEADAQEPCWEYDERLDPHSSIHSSFASQISSLSIRSIAHDEPASPSDHFSSAAVSPNASTTPTSIAPTGPPLSPLTDRHPFRPVHIRTTSLPTVPIKSSQSAKRRPSPLSSPSRAPSAPNLSATLKRRRISRSPSYPRAKDTPRWSVGPPSPYPLMNEEGQPKRGLTPFAYATPFSNAPYIERDRVEVYEDEDDEQDQGEDHALSDFVTEGSEILGQELEEGEWEGVEENLVARTTTIGDVVEGQEFDGGSESSCPSEYPSTQPPLQQHIHTTSFGGTAKAGFRIHVDEEMGEIV